LHDTKQRLLHGEDGNDEVHDDYEYVMKMILIKETMLVKMMIIEEYQLLGYNAV
jgi:hypothetical protein